MCTTCKTGEASKLAVREESLSSSAKTSRHRIGQVAWFLLGVSDETAVVVEGWTYSCTRAHGEASRKRIKIAA